MDGELKYSFNQKTGSVSKWNPKTKKFNPISPASTPRVVWDKMSTRGLVPLEDFGGANGKNWRKTRIDGTDWAFSLKTGTINRREKSTKGKYQWKKISATRVPKSLLTAMKTVRAKASSPSIKSSTVASKPKTNRSKTSKKNPASTRKNASTSANSKFIVSKINRSRDNYPGTKQYQLALTPTSLAYNIKDISNPLVSRMVVDSTLRCALKDIDPNAVELKRASANSYWVSIRTTNLRKKMTFDVLTLNRPADLSGRRFRPPERRSTSHSHAEIEVSHLGSSDRNQVVTRLRSLVKKAGGKTSAPKLAALKQYRPKSTGGPYKRGDAVQSATSLLNGGQWWEGIVIQASKGTYFVKILDARFTKTYSVGKTYRFVEKELRRKN